MKDRRTDKGDNASATVTLATSQSAGTYDSTSNQVSVDSNDFSLVRKSTHRLFQNAQEENSINGLKALLPEKDRGLEERLADSLSAATLRFSSVGLVGREKEVKSLHTCFDRVLARRRKRPEGSLSSYGGLSPEENIGREFVMIGGISGVGKSSLARMLSERVKKVGGLFVEGKYDSSRSDEPYHGISAACSEICGCILELRDSDPDRFNIIRERLIEELGDVTHVLARIVPPLEEIVVDSSVGVNQPRTYSITDLDQAKERLQFSFRKFIRLLTSDVSFFGGVLVMVLDDLQWADSGSFDLIKTILSDHMYSNILLIGCYRSDEIDEGHIVSQCRRVAYEKLKESNVELTRIMVENLTLGAINDLLVSLLSHDNSETMPLAQLCHSRSLGNPFHVITFLRVLEAEKLLEFNVGVFRWRWDLERIQNKISVTSNVVELVTSKLKYLPKEVLVTLHVAACLGGSFDLEKLHLVLMELKSMALIEGESVESSEEVFELLQIAVKEHFLEAQTNRSFRWSHSKVQEACDVLGEEIRFAIGDILMQKLEKDELRCFVFVVANLLEAGKQSDFSQDQKLNVATLYHLAATEALASSSFSSAVKYAKNGIGLLPPPQESFTNNYVLSLELYTIAADVEGCLGHKTELHRYGSVVLSFATTTDKLRCYKRMILSELLSESPQKAEAMCLDYLEELGVNFPKGSLQKKIKAECARKYLNSMSPSCFDSLPFLNKKDEHECQICALNLLTMCYVVSDNFLPQIIAIHQSASRTLSKGLTPDSVETIGAIGLIQLQSGKFDSALNFANLALKIVEKFNLKREVAHSFVQIYYLLLPWKNPLQNSLRPLLHGYRIGLECGDTEFSCWCITFYNIMTLLDGTPLKSIESNCRTYLPQIVDLERNLQVTMMELVWQLCQNLLGLSDEPTDLTGFAMDEEKFKQSNLASLSKTLFSYYQMFKSFLFSIFGRHESGANFSLQRNESCISGCGAFAMADSFHRALSLYDMARKTRKHKYKSAGKTAHKRIETWARAGNPNVLHFLSILDAERSALNNDVENAKKMYEKAIVLASRSGLIQDNAVASERYGDYLVNELKDKQAAKYRLEASIRYYSEWGAMAKVEQMHKKYSDLWPQPLEISCV